MFMHLLKNRTKVLLHNKTMLFWTLLFPIVLTTFFHFAFSNLGEAESFKEINIALVDDASLEKNIYFKETITTLSKGNNRLLKTKYVKNQKEAEKLLTENKIKGYIGASKELYIVTKQNSMEATILKTIVDTYYSKISMMENISKENLTEEYRQALLASSEEMNFLEDKSQKNIDFTVIFFYTMIGMVCLYAGFFGIDAVSETEARLSTRGARMSISPVHKGKVLLAFTLVGWALQYIENLFLLAYMIFILGVDFGNHIGLILLLLFVGSFVGIALGTFIGAIGKKGPEIKIPILLTIDLVFSFFAGMMVWQMKYFIDKTIPILSAINPVAMITDALYALYYYDTFTLYFTKLIHLSLLGIILLVGSYFLIRRKKYDSI